MLPPIRSKLIHFHVKINRLHCKSCWKHLAWTVWTNRLMPLMDEGELTVREAAYWEWLSSIKTGILPGLGPGKWACYTVQVLCDKISIILLIRTCRFRHSCITLLNTSYSDFVYLTCSDEICDSLDVWFDTVAGPTSTLNARSGQSSIIMCYSSINDIYKDLGLSCFAISYVHNM